MRTAAFCEINPYCRAVLAKHWPGVRCYADVHKITREQLESDGMPAIDLVCGGFPCQPYSAAGARLGSEDDRALWPQYRRIVKEFRPAWVLGENVVGIVDMALDNVLADLEGLGYAARAFDIPACAIGAIHQRRRVFIVAHDQGDRREGGEQKAIQGGAAQQGGFHVGVSEIVGRRSDLPAPQLSRGGDGVPQRLHALGNAVVPQIAEIFGRAIMTAERIAA